MEVKELLLPTSKKFRLSKICQSKPQYLTSKRTNSHQPAITICHDIGEKSHADHP